MSASPSYARLLSDVSGRLGQADGTDSVADTVLPSVVEAFGAAVGTIALFHSPSTLRLAGVVGIDRQPQLRRTWEQFDVGAGVPLAETARTGEPVWIPDVDGDGVRARYPAWPAESVNRSVCVVPMCSGGRLIGVLGLTWTAPRSFRDDEKDVLLAVGSITAAACAVGGQALGRRLGVVDSETHRDDVHLAHLVRSTATAVPRTVGTVGASGAPTLSWLLEAPNDAALGVACEGVLALARRHGSPPGVAARHVADLCHEMRGRAAGVALQVGPGAAWVAVAGIDDCVVLSRPGLAGPGVATHAGAVTAADEHVVVPDGDGALVLALLLAEHGDDARTDDVVAVARAEFDRGRGLSAEELLERVGERLGEHGLDSALLGALAVVVAPRSGEVVLRRRLPARPLAVPLARRFALAALGPDPDPDTAFRLGLAVDELVSNATRHCEEVLEVTVRPTATGLRVEVTDDDDRTPGPRTPPQPAGGELPESGRGLVLLEAVAEQWGVVTREQGGKTVWAHVRT